MKSAAITWWFPLGGAIPTAPLTVDLIGPALAWALLVVMLLGMACAALWLFTNRKAPSQPGVSFPVPFTGNRGPRVPGYRFRATGVT